MKKYITILGCFLAISSNAQTTIADDTTKITLGGKEIIIQNNDDEIDEIDDDSDDEKNVKVSLGNAGAKWSGLYFGANGFLTPNNSMQLNTEDNFMDIDMAKSLNMSWNFASLDIQLGTPHLHLVSGMGFEFNRYGLKRNVRLGYNADSLWGTNDTVNTFDKNFLKATYFHIPLLFQVNTSKHDGKGVHFQVGAIAGVRAGGKQKVKYILNGDKHKENIKGIYNINPFKVSATARIGYDNLTLYANYGLTSLFEKDRGPEVNPFAVGLAFTF